MTEMLKGFEVETCVELPTTECGDCDMDRAKFRRFDCATKEQAIALAKRLLPSDKFGAVQVTEFVRVPYEAGCPVLRKEYVADTFEVSD